MNDHDRDAILARRALFISAALAGLACTTQRSTDQPRPGTDTVESPDPSVAPSKTEVTPSENRPGDGTRPSWAEVMAAAPPLDLPTGLTMQERELLSSLASYVRRHYGEVAAIWEALPSCAPSQADCDAWMSAIDTIYETAVDDWGDLCALSPGYSDTILERQRAHARYLERVIGLLVADLDAAVDARSNPADTDAWQTQRAPLADLPRQPCLTCVPMRRAVAAIPSAIPFGDGQASLAQTSNVGRVLERVSTGHQRNRKLRAKLIVRGHADPSESDPEALGRERAEAVAQALIGLGAKRKHIEVRSYGAELRITNDPSEAELNRRVDFVVVRR